MHRSLSAAIPAQSMVITHLTSQSMVISHLTYSHGHAAASRWHRGAAQRWRVHAGGLCVGGAAGDWVLPVQRIEQAVAALRWVPASPSAGLVAAGRGVALGG
jgi:hypothetical protein